MSDTHLVPAESLRILFVVSQLGLVLFMFCVGQRGRDRHQHEDREGPLFSIVVSGAGARGAAPGFATGGVP